MFRSNETSVENESERAGIGYARIDISTIQAQRIKKFNSLHLSRREYGAWAHHWFPVILAASSLRPKRTLTFLAAPQRLTPSPVARTHLLCKKWWFEGGGAVSSFTASTLEGFIFSWKKQTWPLTTQSVLWIDSQWRSFFQSLAKFLRSNWKLKFENVPLSN